jgi:hypothetical protein
LHALLSKCVQTIRASTSKKNWNIQNMVGTATLFPHSAQTKLGTSDLMGALGKQTPSASMV